MSEHEEIRQIVRQGEVIISLLGRLAFKPDEVRAIVKKGKRNPDKYVEGYKACNGTRDLTEIAAIVGVTPGTLSPILQDWAEVGIVYELLKPGGTFYKGVVRL